MYNLAMYKYFVLQLITVEADEDISDTDDGDTTDPNLINTTLLGIVGLIRYDTCPMIGCMLQQEIIKLSCWNVEDRTNKKT